MGRYDFWPKLVEALSGEPVRVIASMDEPEKYEAEVPDHFLVREHLPAGLVLERTSLVVGLGKSSTMLGALANAVPMLLFPVWSEQPYVAARCEAAGVATILIPHVPADMAPGKIRSAVRALLKDDNPVCIAISKMRRELTEGGFNRAADLLAYLAEHPQPLRRKGVGA